MTTEIIHEYPVLYSLSSKGKVKQWGVRVVSYFGEVFVISYHGYLNQKIVEEKSSPILGKNIGKKNETTPSTQAMSDALSKWNKKIDQNYTVTIPTSTDSFTKLRPMLAHKWTERKHNITFPIYVQPKLNGVRCLVQECFHIKDPSTFTFNSRGGKEYTTLNHIALELEEITGVLPGEPLDGEIFSRNMELEEISKAVKKLGPTTERLEYWIYDIADPTKTFSERLKILKEIEAELPEEEVPCSIKIVPTYYCRNEEELMKFHKIFSLDYEGTMIRNMEGKYVFDYRSTDLLKLKDFLDEEFEIIGGKSGSGSDEGTVIFRCKTKADVEFDVRPRGTRERRREYLTNLPSYLSKDLTVRYQNLSIYGVPIFPVGIVVRDFE